MDRFDFKKDIKLEWVLAIDKKPKREGKDFVYNANYSCVLNNKKGSGGIVDLKVIIPKEIKNKEMNNVTLLTAQIISSFIQLKYEILEDKIDGADEMFNAYSYKGFFGGEPKINIDGKKLTKEEYLNQEIESITTINDVINGDSEINGIKAKKVITFKDFLLASENMEDLR